MPKALPLTWLALALAAPAVYAADGPSTREMERINWMEFREWVPGRIRTVLLPTGTLEPHGVTANGADILAPVAIAREIAPRLSAMVAPVVPYGFTGSMDAFPGAFTVPEEAYRAYVRAVLVGLARNGFKSLYKEGQAYPRFDAAKAKVYYKKVVDKVGHLVEDTIQKWDLAGL